uniref:Aminotransferase class V domain-containing protein n=1 Tax=Aplanochytrium stocchinoi TaxID=215587 RepID=A0A7S3PIX8_9STRA
MMATRVPGRRSTIQQYKKRWLSYPCSTTKAVQFSLDNLSHIRKDLYGDQENVSHFNSAGDSPMPRPVLEVVKNHLDLEARIGGYKAAEEVESLRSEVYGKVAELIGAKSVKEIALVESATVGWTRGFYSLAKAKLKPGSVLLTCEAEYAAQWVAMKHVCRDYGAKLVTIPSDPVLGEIDLEQLPKLLHDHNVGMVCVTHIPTNGGLVNPVEQVGQVIKSYNEKNKDSIVYIVDACQSVGQWPVSVKSIHCDMLSACGRKFLRGPRGTGFLYMKQTLAESIEPSHMDHYCAQVELDPADTSSDPTVVFRQGAGRFEFWEASIASQLGFGAAIDYAQSIGVKAIQTRVTMLADRLREGLANLPNVSVHDIGTVKCAIVSFSAEGISTLYLKTKLESKGHCLGVVPSSSTPIDSARRRLPGFILRASVHYFCLEKEIDTLVEDVENLVMIEKEKVSPV